MVLTNPSTLVNEIAGKIKKLVEKELRRNVNITHSSPRPGDVKRNYSDISKAEKMLGYKPRFDLEPGLKQTFEYFVNGMIA